MANLFETARDLDKHLIDGWAGQTPIATDNVPYKETQGQAFLESRFVPHMTYNVNIGNSCNRKRTEGVLSIVIRTPLEEGVGQAYTIANDLQAIMDNQCLAPNLFTLASSIYRVGDTKDGWFSLLCDVPFISDET